ncbi:MarR family transcriptional regulator, partial [Pseudomonas aeruginosa]
MRTRGKVARPDGVEESLMVDNHLCFKLYAASRAVIRGYGPLLGQIGLTSPQY